MSTVAKKILRAVALFPLSMAGKYANRLTHIKHSWGYFYFEIIIKIISSQVTVVSHKSNGLDIKMKYYTPNAICRFRAQSFSDKEPETLEWIDSYGGGTFYDIGANVGLYSIYYAKKYSGKVYAFEPSAFNLGLLVKNISINNVTDRVIIIPNPLTSHQQIANFLVSESQEGGASSTFGEEYGYDGQPLKVEFSYQTTGYSLDLLISVGSLPRVPSLMKIDVDGIENLILRGGINLLSNQSLRTVLIEVNEDFIKAATEVNEIMHLANFKLAKKVHAQMFEGTVYGNTFNQMWIRQ